MLEVEFITQGRRWRADLSQPVDLAITLEFPGPQPRFFAEAPAWVEPLRVGHFTGAVSGGASCNCGVYTFAPHCHGTHTECVGHVTDDGTALASLTPAAPTLALLVTVRPQPFAAAGVESAGPHAPDDPVITRALLDVAASRWAHDPWTALVVRTLPNDPLKRQKVYDGACPAPYFTADAMAWVVDRAVTSLVVDLPSLDRADDGGLLLAHRTFWGLPPGVRDARQARRGRALVTEFAYVPDTALDGLYLLDLHVPAFAADAAPSRPVLYPTAEQTPREPR
jgi:kynurenine formamidase